MRLGVLDIGSTSAHLHVVDVYPGSPPLAVYRTKRPTKLAEAIRADGADMLAGAAANRAFHELAVPAVLLWADRGLLNQTPGAYTAENTAGLNVPAVRVPDTNHYSILADPRHAATVAEHILSHCAVA